jgi:membrane AbrB-like protein
MRGYYATMSVFALRAGATLALALAAALLCSWLRTPLPWMIGPLLATSVASVLGAPTRSWAPLRNGGQWVIGAALGLHFTPQVTALVAGLWWAIAAGIAWALALGWLFGLWLDRGHGDAMALPPRERLATSHFAGAIGGASEMTLLAEREGGRTDLVAAAHSLRLVIVTVLIPFAFSFAGIHGLDAAVPGAREVRWTGLGVLGLATLAGALVMRRTGRANPWFMGALLAAMGLAMAGIELSAMPRWLTNAAQLVIGVSLGVRFQAAFLRTAPRWLASVATGTLVMIGVCGGFAALLAALTGLPVATLVLGTSPGGIAEMAITAQVLALGVPVVTAFQVCRLVAVLVLVEPLFRWRLRHLAGAARPPGGA